MYEVKITVSEEALVAFNLSPDEAAGAVSMATTVKLYEMGRLLSSAATLAGVPRRLFLSKLSDYGMATFRQTEDELLEDLARA